MHIQNKKPGQAGRFGDRFKSSKEMRKNRDDSNRRLEEKGKPPAIKLHTEYKQTNISARDIKDHIKELGEVPNTLLTPKHIGRSYIALSVDKKIIGLEVKQSDDVQDLTLARL